MEFKQSQVSVPASLYETVVSFSNTDGGIIVLGVDDEGKIIGIDQAKLQVFIKEIVANLNNVNCVSPALYLKPVVVSHPLGEVIVLRVPASSMVHSHGKRIFWRSGDNDQDVTLNQQKVSDIFFRKREYFSESIIYPYLSFDDLNPELFRKARAIIASLNSSHPWLTMTDEKMLTSASLYWKDYRTGNKGLTLASALIFGKDETISHLAPGYKIDALVRKVNIDRYDDRLTLRTNLIDTYIQLLEFLKKHLNEKFFIEDGQRKDLRELIFREVVGNVIVHREYTNAYPSEIIVYADKVLATNPNKALFYGPIDPEQFNPYPKNPNIRKFFTAFGWTDELGSGIRNTTKYLSIYVPGAKPVFIENDIFTTEIPLVNISLANYRKELLNWFGFSDEITRHIADSLHFVALPTSFSDAHWNHLLLSLVPSWTVNGIKFKSLKWPQKQAVTENEIKKIPDWNEKSTKLLHKKTSYFIRILIIALQPVSMENLMKWMEYSNKHTFRSNYLLPLQQAGLIKMTHPDKPRTPDQKYLTTQKGKLFLTGQL